MCSPNDAFDMQQAGGIRKNKINRQNTHTHLYVFTFCFRFYHSLSTIKLMRVGMRFQARICEIESNKVVFLHVCFSVLLLLLLLLFRLQWYATHKILHTLYNVAYYFILLFFFVVVDVVVVVFPQSFRICIYFFVDARKCAPMCASVCSPAKLFCIYSIPYICTRYVYEFAGKKVKRQIEKQAKVSEKVANSILEYVNGYERTPSDV